MDKPDLPLIDPLSPTSTSQTGEISSEITVEWGGTGEKIELEFILSIPRVELVAKWNAALPANVRLKEMKDESALSFALSMSEEAGDWTFVDILFEAVDGESTRVHLAHSFLLDEAECKTQEAYWKTFIYIFNRSGLNYE